MSWVGGIVNRTVKGSGELAKITFMQRGLTVYRVADSHWTVGWNRYHYLKPSRTIGLVVITGRIAWGFQWTKS